MEESQIDIVDLEASPLSKSMQNKLQTLWGNTSEGKNCTIFRTPHIISQSKKNLFEPTAISIGPFHRGQKHLRAMEEQKWRFLQYFLSRGDHISLDLCISEMKSLEQRTRRCYTETFDDLDSDTFAEMMLLDGCFFLEYFLKWEERVSFSICDVGWNSCFIPDDFLLLENQIPFFIVEKLCEIGLKQEDRNNLINILISIFNQYTPNYYIIASTNRNPPPAEIQHLLHLWYHCFVPNLETPVPLSSNIYSIVIPSATELKQKGLKFKENHYPKHMLEISFKNGVLKIPKLQFLDSTKLFIANLMAFEHSKYGKEELPFTCFVYFLDNLINTPNDVRILQECGIIENSLGSEEELAHFINHVSEGAIIIESEFQYLAELYTEVNRFSGSSWNRHRAILIRDYFSSPWTALSLAAALILLVLTCVQSFYAVYAYKFPPSS